MSNDSRNIPSYLHVLEPAEVRTSEQFDRHSRLHSDREAIVRYLVAISLGVVNRTPPENARYVSGFSVTMLRDTETGQSMLALKSENPPTVGMAMAFARAGYCIGKRIPLDYW